MYVGYRVYGFCWRTGFRISLPCWAASQIVTHGFHCSAMGELTDDLLPGIQSYLSPYWSDCCEGADDSHYRQEEQVIPVHRNTKQH